MTNIFKPALQLGDLRLGTNAFKGVYEEVEILPTREQQVFTPSEGKDAISKVTCAPIPEEYVVPAGEIRIEKDGEYDVGNFAKAVVVVSGKQIDVPLSSAFAAATSIYYFQINDDVVLFSANVDNVGVWAYSVKNETFTQLYAAGRDFQHFKIVDNDCFISSNQPDTGLLLYDITANTITKIYDGFNWQHIQAIGEDLYISCASYQSPGILLYKKDTKTITKIYSSGENWRDWVAVGNDWLIFSWGNNGILLYQPKTMEFTRLRSAGSYRNRQFINNGIFITGNSSTINSQGVYFYDIAAKTLTLLGGEGVFLGSMQQVGSDLLVIGVNDNSTNASDAKGVFLYDGEAKTFTQIYESSYKYGIFQPSGNDVLIVSQQASTGILLYEAATKTVKQIYESGMWKYMLQVGNDCLFGGSNTTSKGMLLYDATTKTITQVLEDTSYGWGYSYCAIGNDYLLSANSGNGIVLYEAETKTATKIYTSGSSYRFLKCGNDCLIYTNQQSYTGIWLYNGETKTVTKIFGYGYYYDTFKFDENGNVYISASDKTKSPYTLYYDAAAKTASLAGYYVELE